MPIKSKIKWYIFHAVGLLTIIIYWPSLSGPFLFDDIPNLQTLGLNGGINDLQSWLDFVFSGRSSFLGRPLSLATFTLNAQTWPTDPFPFKLTNIVIHCFNAWLVFYFFKQLADLYNQNNSVKIIAFLPLVGAAIWLLHPIHLTTVLQVVQRMTLLSGTFTLISLIGYTSYINKHKLVLNKSFLLLIVFLCFMGILGVLSKETAIATPLFMFALNYTVFRKALNSTPKFTLVWQCLLLLGPLVVFIFGTLYYNEQHQNTWLLRDFTLIERCLTETRILFDYLSSIFLPQASGSGMFHDDIAISTSVTTPISTLFSVLGIPLLITTAIKLKKSFPFVSLAILWYFLGHIFESTIWPLELYFEHRNYLPSLCLVFIIFQLSLALTAKSKKMIILLTSSYLLLISLVTAITTPVWGDKLRLFTTWAEENPTSIRAQHAAALIWLFEYEDPISSRVFLIQAFNHNPMSLGTRIRLIGSYCYFEKVNDDINLFISGLENLKPDPLYLNAIADIVTLQEQNSCKSLKPELIINVLTKLENNQRIISTAGSWLFHHKARMLFVAGKNANALIYAEKALQITPYLGTSILKIEIAVKMGDKAMARDFLQEALDLEENQISLLKKHQAEKYYHLKELLRAK